MSEVLKPQKTSVYEGLTCPDCGGHHFTFGQYGWNTQTLDTVKDDWDGGEHFHEGQYEVAVRCANDDCERLCTDLFAGVGYELYHDYFVTRRDQTQGGISSVELPPAHWKSQNGMLRHGEACVCDIRGGVSRVDVWRKRDVSGRRMADLSIEAPIDDLIAFFGGVLSQLLHEKERFHAAQADLSAENARQDGGASAGSND